ncbi:hypothetical protein GCM10027579_29390 [Calidifontibacter terrae]
MNTRKRAGAARESSVFLPAARAVLSTTVRIEDSSGGQPDPEQHWRVWACHLKRKPRRRAVDLPRHVRMKLVMSLAWQDGVVNDFVANLQVPAECCPDPSDRVDNLAVKGWLCPIRIDDQGGSNDPAARAPKHHSTRADQCPSGDIETL